MDLTPRHKQCLEALEELGQATAKEVTEYLYDKGYTKVLERNIAHPRLNELEGVGIVSIIGKKLDPLTDKMVSIYQVV